ncbi:MAG: hypothetical protein K8T26_09380 [Lentisphaerae bacterium]|nr:hypothetical protein [Lentisphaerota bacterium]
MKARFLSIASSPLAAIRRANRYVVPLLVSGFVYAGLPGSFFCPVARAAEPLRVVVEQPGVSGAAQADLASGTMDARAKSGPASVNASASLADETMHVDAANRDVSGSADLNLNEQTIAGRLEAGDTKGNVHADLNSDTVEASVQAGQARADGTANLAEGTVHLDVASPDAKGTADVDLNKQTLNAEFEAGNATGTVTADKDGAEANVHTEVGASQAFSQTGANGSMVAGNVQAGASGDATIKIGEGSADVTLEGQVGLAAELEAASERLSAGNEDVGASAQLKGKVEALIGAKGTIEAHLDETGLTLGVDARAGAYVSAEVELDFEAHIFGIKTNVTVTAEGHAGAMAYGSAVVRVGFDGMIEFELGAGVSIGIGGSLGLAFSVDASELIDSLGLPDMEALIVWLAEFVEDPSAMIDKLVLDARDAAVRAGFEIVSDLALEGVRLAADSVNNLVQTIVLPSIAQLPPLWPPLLTWNAAPPISPPPVAELTDAVYMGSVLIACCCNRINTAPEATISVVLWPDPIQNLPLPWPVVQFDVVRPADVARLPDTAGYLKQIHDSAAAGNQVIQSASAQWRVILRSVGR